MPTLVSRTPKSNWLETKNVIFYVFVALCSVIFAILAIHSFNVLDTKDTKSVSNPQDAPYIRTELSFMYKGKEMSFVWEGGDIFPNRGWDSGNLECYSFNDSEGTSWVIPFEQCVKKRYWVYPKKKEER